jgi:hypothetical protein
MKITLRTIICVCLALSMHSAYSQGQPPPTPTLGDSLVPVLTADSLASGNYKDILISFYQLAASNLTGPNKEFRFATSPYAILLRNNPGVAVDSLYDKYKYWRKLNVSVDARMDSAYHFNGLALGLTYALVDHRDITLNSKFSRQYLAKKKGDYQWYRLHFLTDSIIHHAPADPTQKAAYIRQLDSLADCGTCSYLPTVDSILKTRIRAAALAAGDTDLIDPATRQLRETPGVLAKLRKDKPVEFSRVYDSLVSRYIPAIATTPIGLSLHGELEDAFYNPADSATPFSQLDTALQSLMKQVAKDYGLQLPLDSMTSNPNLIVYKIKTADFINLKDSFQTKGLWTIGVNDTTYFDGNLAKDLQFNTEWTTKLKLKFLQPRKNLELQWDLKANVQFMADTSKPGRNLKRQTWYAEPGLNLVIRDKSRQSFLEFKVSGGINEVFHGTYKGEDPLDVTLNGTLRVRIFNEIWVPLQIKYDPKTGNVFGFLNVTMNFTGLGSILNGIGQKKSAKS